MKHNSNADFHGNVKIRGVVVDDLTTQGGFYSEQFGEVAYESSALTVRESDGTPPTFSGNSIIFDSEAFYLSSDSSGNPTVSFRGTATGGAPASPSSLEVAQGPNSYTAVDQLNFNTTYFYLTGDAEGDPVVNWDLGEGFKEREILLDGDSKNIFWDWSLGNSFFLPLEKNTTLHEPSNYKGSGAQQVNLVVVQPSVGFYNVSFGRNFIFPGGASDDDSTTQVANATDFFSFHYSSSLRRIIVMTASELFY